MAVDRPELALLVRPFVPDRDTLFLEPAHIGVAAQEPEQLVDDGFEMQLLRRDQRETLREIEAHLVAEDGQRTGAGAVMLLKAMLKHAFHQIVILAHLKSPRVVQEFIVQTANSSGPSFIYPQRLY